MSKVLKMLTWIITINVAILRVLGLPPFTYDKAKLLYKSSKLRTTYLILFLGFVNIYLFNIALVISNNNLKNRIQVELATNVTHFFMLFSHISIMTIIVYHLIYSEKFLKLMNYSKSAFREIHQKLLEFESQDVLNDKNIKLKEIYVVNIIINTMSLVIFIDEIIVLVLISELEIMLSSILAILAIFQSSMISLIVNFLVSYQSILLYYYKKLNNHLEYTIKRLDAIKKEKVYKHILDHLQLSEAIDELASIHNELSKCTQLFVEFYTIHTSASLFECFLSSTLGVCDYLIIEMIL